MRTEIKIHAILYLTQIYFLTKYLVENAENSVSDTSRFQSSLGEKISLRLAPSALASVNIYLKILIFSCPTSDYAPPS